jgi:hypothetical protein
MIKRLNPPAGGRRHGLTGAKKAVTIDPFFFGGNLFAASISPTVTGLLDTLLTHVSSDVVKVSWLFAK